MSLYEVTEYALPRDHIFYICLHADIDSSTCLRRDTVKLKRKVRSDVFVGYKSQVRDMPPVLLSAMLETPLMPRPLFLCCRLLLWSLCPKLPCSSSLLKDSRQPAAACRRSSESGHRF